MTIDAIIVINDKLSKATTSKLSATPLNPDFTIAFSVSSDKSLKKFQKRVRALGE